jgi:hypothetical protein
MMMRKKKISTSPHSMTARRIRKENGRKSVMKGVMTKGVMTNISVSIVAEKGIHQTSVGCWTKTRAPEWFDPEILSEEGERSLQCGSQSFKRGLELWLMVLSFPKALDLLDNSTPHSRGAVDMIKGNGGVIFGDGKNNDADEISTCQV